MYYFGTLLAALQLVACAPKHEGVIPNASSGLTGSTSSIAIFEATLKPVIQQNCAGCHGISQAPKFAVSDSATSHDLLISTALVDLTAPANSRLVTKIQGGHQSFAVTVATDIQTAITNWSAQLQAATGNVNPGVVVEPLTPTYSSISKLILQNKCATCHTPGGDSPYYDTYANTKKSVVANNYLQSKLYTEVQSGSMPRGASDLSAEEQTAIKDWIQAGALNN